MSATLPLDRVMDVRAAEPRTLTPSRPSGHEVVRGLRRLRAVTLTHAFTRHLAQSRLRLALVLFFGAVFWGGLYVMFHDGFVFLQRHRLIGGPLIEMLFSLFFGSLLLMLVFSTGIILYASLFASREAEFLLCQPISSDRVFAFKFQEAMFFSCWGFVLLGSPLMIAYGRTAGAPWSFYLISLIYFLAYALLPGSIGALACLGVAVWFPRRKKEALIALAGLVVVAGAIGAFSLWRSMRSVGPSRQFLNRLLERTSPLQLPFLPSAWISKGLLAAAHPEGTSDAIFYLAALLANGWAAYLLVSWAFFRKYRQGYDRCHGLGGRRKRQSSLWLNRWIDRVYAPLPAPVRVLVLKDIRTFLRDPLQWSQVTIFTGLLAVYLLNLNRMTYYSASPYWRNLIGFFNLAVTGLLLSTFTSRFIFPLVSLELQKFWILGLCPVSRSDVLWGKFWFAASGALVVTTALTALGASMLRLEPLIIALQMATVSTLCFGLCGIAVGLGARFPELKQTDPSKIAAGFGGTLNLVASLLFIVLVVGTMALPCHLYSITLSKAEGTIDFELAAGVTGLSFERFRVYLVLSMVLSLAAGLIATLLPMRLGAAALRRREF